MCSVHPPRLGVTSAIALFAIAAASTTVHPLAHGHPEIPAAKTMEKPAPDVSKLAERPWLDASLPVGERARLVVAAMTLEECALQTDQARVDAVDETSARAGVGSIILATSATAGNDKQLSSSAALVDGLQRAAVEGSRLGVPLLAARDVIHGHHTVFPIPLGQACAFDPDLVEAGARAAAVECSADGVRWTFSPMLDVCRDPRWGRVAESYGESAFLAGELGAAAVRGYQKRGDLSAPDAVAACAKHFAGYSAAEGGRDYDTTEISNATLEDVYLPPFREAVVGAQCLTVMAGFNALGGLPAAVNRDLLTGVLKERWAFPGVVVTDWDAVREACAHGVAADGAEAAAQAIVAGSDVDMVSGLFKDHLPALAARDVATEAALREAARRVVELKLRLGLFERPYADPAAAGRAAAVDRTPHLELARRAAAQCAVLLVNHDETLPLTAPAPSVAVTGPLAEATGELLGTWTLDGIPSEVTSVADALDQALAGAGAGLQGAVTRAPWQDRDAVVRAARASDVVVAVVGEGPELSGEANSLAAPELAKAQVDFLDALLGGEAAAEGTSEHAHGGRGAQPPAPRQPPRVVLVIISGRPLVLPRSADRCAAVLWTCHPGTEGGRGLADVLTGAAEPGGRLAFTLPRHAGQVPLYHDHKPTGRPLGEYYRAEGGSGGTRYLDSAGSPKFPFGYGLTYTSFRVEGPPRVVHASADAGVVVRCRVVNTGARAGTAVVQAYAGQPVAELSQPVRRLAAFARAHLEAGAGVEVELVLPPRAIAYCHRDGGRRVDATRLHIGVGLHARDCALADAAEAVVEVDIPAAGTLVL